MKKTVLFLGVMIYSFLMVDMAFAGSLNEHEQAIIEAAGEVYEYNGTSYKVEKRYIDQLINYLSRDDIDITAEDKDILIGLAYANIELGVKDGYLKPIDNLSIQGDHEKKSTDVKIEDSVKEIMESVGMDITDIESNMPSLIGESDIIERLKDKAITSNAVDDIDTSKGADMRDVSKEDDLTDTLKGVDIRDISEDNENTDTLDKANDNSMEDEIIKQTGYNLNRTIYIMVGLGFLMIIGIFIAIKNNYFKHAYEQTY